ncbi:MAG: flagellar hook basal-body protein [Candidatus Margulisbacteria bacterium]|nr:flagellar hook basal-body protein [Candidatus Margulisiibacteriota bacterium]
MTDRIFEIGKAGLDSADQRVRKLMDNMVSARVPGYKKAETVTRGFPLELEAASKRISAMKPAVETSYINTQPGALIKTDGKLDMALGSDGYFVLSAPWGDGYTRDGRFQLDRDGRMLSVAGNLPIQGEAGPIIVTPGAQVEFTQTGEIMVDGIMVDKLRVVKPESKDTLETLNGSLFKKKDPFAVMLSVENPRVIQGYVESSNVSVIDLMMEMMELEKTYSLNTQVIKSRSESLARGNELGRSQ